MYLSTDRFRYYAFHALGQAASRTGRVKFHDADWKPAVTLRLLADQQDDSGYWEEPMFRPASQLVGTSLALIFLTEK
jgi:hypothetical protein